MSERKVLNKYYPPDFDPSKIPRARLGKNKQFTVRLMAPCNMRCNTCGEYIYKGKKFNARKEDVENQDYLGIRIYRFYIKCTRCLQEISFKTDPVSTDYIIEAGATRNFMALKLAEEQAEREEQAEKEDEATNPMKVLEKRTEASKNEMASLEALEELRELNQRKLNPDYGTMLDKYEEHREEALRREEEEDERMIQEMFGKNGPVIRRIEDDSESDEDKPPRKVFVSQKPTDILSSDSANGAVNEATTKSSAGDTSIGLLSVNKKKLVLVKKPANQQVLKAAVAVNPSPTKNPDGLKPNGNSNSLSLLGAYSSSDGDSD